MLEHMRYHAEYNKCSVLRDSDAEVPYHWPYMWNRTGGTPQGRCMCMCRAIRPCHANHSKLTYLPSPIENHELLSSRKPLMRHVKENITHLLPLCNSSAFCASLPRFMACMRVFTQLRITAQSNLVVFINLSY